MLNVAVPPVATTWFPVNSGLPSAVVRVPKVVVMVSTAPGVAPVTVYRVDVVPSAFTVPESAIGVPAKAALPLRLRPACAPAGGVGLAGGRASSDCSDQNA